MARHPSLSAEGEIVKRLCDEIGAALKGDPAELREKLTKARTEATRLARKVRQVRSDTIREAVAAIHAEDRALEQGAREVQLATALRGREPARVEA